MIRPSGSEPVDSPTAATQLRRVLSALEEGDLERAQARLRGILDDPATDPDEVVRAFDRQFDALPDLPWKVMTRTANCAVRAGFYRLAERALELLSEWPIGLPDVYAESVRHSLDCGRLDLAAVYLGKLRQEFADHPATGSALERYREAHQLFAGIAALGDDPPDTAAPSAELLPDPRIDLARALLRANKPGEALELGMAVCAAEEGDPLAWVLVAEAYLRLGQSAAAGRSYRRALALESRNEWIERLGDIHMTDGNPHVAIRCYGHCSYHNTHDVQVRRKLAQATGRVWCDRLQVEPWHRDGPPKYFDCFMFNGEFDLAAMRFAELWDHVDKFIVVEAAETFTGNRKALMFKENMQLFRDFQEKIVHVPVETFPAYCEHPWAKDFYQRDAVVRGLDGLAAENDFVVIADADELWSWDVVSRFEGEVATLRMRMAKHFLNYQPVGTGRANRDTAAVSRYRHIREHGASAVRFNLARRQRKLHDVWLDDAGWHFHALGDERFIQYKFSSYAHREHHNKPDLVELDRVRARLARLRNGEHDEDWTAVPAGRFLPACIGRDSKAFEHLLLPSDVADVSACIRHILATS